MGQVLSFVTGIINTVAKIRSEAKQDKIDEDRRKLDKIKTPIEPPKFYRNIEERTQSVKDERSPYSVQSIKNTLQRDVVPTGYSLEQLASVGFKDSVDKFNERKESRRNELKKEFLNFAGLIEKEINEGFEDLSKEDRMLFEKAGVLGDEGRDKILKQISEWKKQIQEGTASEEVLDDMIDILKSRVDLVQDIFSQGEFEQKIREKTEQAESMKTSQVLKLVRRALQVV
jgi:hypothetical protein